MREHPEYSHLWGRLSELPDAEIEQGGVSPIMHIVTHTVIENQLVLGEPKEVGRTLKRLMRQGVSRHEAVHRVGSAWAEELFYTLRDRRPFDEPAYIRKLQELEW
ncbi:MAG: DUF1841 family protein [Thermoflexales bacterium]|nr:DUF1841 family protein [Thermoflexales bacterium]